MEGKDILINKLKDALERMIAVMNDLGKEMEDELQTNPTLENIILTEMK